MVVNTQILQEIENQIKTTITHLDKKFQQSGEVIIHVYLKKYRDALKEIENNNADNQIKEKLLSLLHCARGYLETSSDYEQKFLNEMGKTENLINKFI